MLSGVWKGCSFLSLDPGINHTGFAHWRIDLQGNVRLSEFGAISSMIPSEDDLERASVIVENVVAHISTYKPAFIFLERPPSTVYYQGRLSPGMIVARAQSVFKVIGVTYAIAIRVRSLTGMRVFPVDPAKWQERSKKKRDGLSIKDWSLRLANTLITQCSDKVPDLRTAKDENIADAVSMGYIAYQTGMAN